MGQETLHLRYTLMAEEHLPSPEHEDNTLLLRILRVKPAMRVMRSVVSLSETIIMTKTNQSVQYHVLPNNGSFVRNDDNQRNRGWPTEAMGAPISVSDA